LRKFNHNKAIIEVYEFKKFLGFEFVKAGEFYLADIPWKGKKGEWEIYASIKLTSESFRKADESAYVVLSDSELKYVGEYTYSLEDRWLSGSYINHHKSDLIEQELKLDKKVTLWLAVKPYAMTPDNLSINISKSLEQELLRQCDLDWNKRSKIKKWESWRAENCIPVSEIIKKHVKCIPAKKTAST
jgi:hypothetical protein